MTTHSNVTRLRFDRNKQKMKLEDLPAAQPTTDKDFRSSKGRSQDADRHVKTFDQKSDKK